MRPIKMLLDISIPKQDYDLEELDVIFGDFDFRFGDKILRFGFGSWENRFIEAKDCEILKFASGNGYFSYPGISNAYIRDILDRGFDPDEIDAKFLSEVDEIITFQVILQRSIVKPYGDYAIPVVTGVMNLEDIPHVLSMEFIDGYDNHYKVDSYVIGNYNLRVDEGIKWREENGTKC